MNNYVILIFPYSDILYWNFHHIFHFILRLYNLFLNFFNIIKSQYYMITFTFSKDKTYTFFLNLVSAYLLALTWFIKISRNAYYINIVYSNLIIFIKLLLILLNCNSNYEIIFMFFYLTYVYMNAIGYR